MSAISSNASSILKNIFWKNVANFDHLTKVYKHQISVLTITCTAIFVAVKYVKRWKHREESTSSVLLQIAKPTEIVIVDDEELCIQAVNELLKLVFASFNDLACIF